MNGEWSDDDIKTADNIGCRVFKEPVTKEIIVWLDEVEKSIRQKRKNQMR